MDEGTPAARSAASIKIVPEPQKGSKKVVFLSQPDSLIKQAATTSFKGAEPVSVR